MIINLRSCFFFIVKRDVCKPVVDFATESFSVFTGRYHQALWAVFDSMLGSYEQFTGGRDGEKLLELMMDRYKEVIDFSAQFFLAFYIKCGRHFVTLVNKKVKKIIFKDKPVVFY